MSLGRSKEKEKSRRIREAKWAMPVGSVCGCVSSLVSEEGNGITFFYCALAK